jgi:hypothetical protein
MNDSTPAQPANSFRITLDIPFAESRMDNTLLAALRAQDENEKLKNISRGALKELFLTKKIVIKGQRAKSSSALAKGITHVDILGH